MRAQAPPSTKKSGPTPSRQTEIGPLNSKDTQEGASIMNDSTAQHPAAADLTAAIERRIGHKVDTIRDIVAFAREHGTTADELVAQAQRDVAADWHPVWCARAAGGCPGGEETMHLGRVRAKKFEEHFTEGNKCHVTARAFMIQSPDPSTWLHDFGFEVALGGDGILESGHAVMSTDRMRDLADWLFTKADELDDWREQHAAELGEEAIADA